MGRTTPSDLTCTSGPSPSLVRSLVLLAAAAFAVALHASTAGAATTRYVATTGVDTGACTSQASPCRTITYGVSKLAGGDTLIVGNGTYTESNPIRYVPSGNSGPDGVAGTADDVYTTVRAQTDFGVLINGSAWSGWTYGINIANSSFLTVRGFRIRANQSNPAGGPAVVTGSHHIKIIRCGFSYAGVTGNVNSMDVSDSRYILIEECYAFGGARYQFIVYWSDYVVMRRNVARNDYWNDTLQSAAFTNYDSSHTVWQNNIAIDSEDSCCNRVHSGLYAGFFGENKNDRTDGVHSTSQEWYGNIVLNYQVEYSGIYDYAMSGSRAMSDNIIWDSLGGYWGADGNGDAPSFGTITRNTFGFTHGIYDYNNGGAGRGVGLEIASNISNTITNSLFPSNHNFGIGDYSTGDYNAYFGNGTAPRGGTARTPAAGAHDVTNHNPIYNASTNPTGSLKYLPRGPEAGSVLATAGAQGSRVGAQVLWKIGVDGTLYGEAGWNTVRAPENGYGGQADLLWPFPNEAVIKADMASYTGPGLSGTRGFCATGTGLYGGPRTLTSYIWEYLGNPCPSSVCSGVAAPAAPTGLKVIR